MDARPLSISWSQSPIEPTPAPGSSLPPGLGIKVAQQTCGGSTRCCTTVFSSYIGGSPTTAGTYNVIVTVVHSVPPPAQGSANYTIVVSGAASAAAKPEFSSTDQVARYKLVDLGTLGGPNSAIFQYNHGRAGRFVGWSEISQTDPNVENY